MRDLTFLEHLEELRKRIIKVILYIVIFSVIAYFFSAQIIDVLKKPVGDLYFFSPVEAFWVRVKASLLTAFIISFPFIIFETWQFVAPGLYEKERKVVLPYIFFVPFLFYLGVIFSLFIILPIGFKILLSFGEGIMVAIIGANHYINFACLLVIAFGLLFEAPIVMLILVQMGIVSPQVLSKRRKEVILGIFIISAIITPSVDAITQILLAGSLYLLFEVSLFFAKRVKRESENKTYN